MLFWDHSKYCNPVKNKIGYRVDTYFPSLFSYKVGKNESKNNNGKEKEGN